MYFVEFADSVLDYLSQIEGLTDDDRAAIIDAVSEELGRDAGRFHALYPLAHESHCFRYDYPHPTSNTVYNFDFVATIAHAEQGVIQIIYVESTRYET